MTNRPDIEGAVTRGGEKADIACYALELEARIAKLEAGEPTDTPASAPSGGVVERIEKAMQGEIFSRAAAQSALSVVLEEIEAEKRAVKDSPDGRAGHGFPYHRIEALERLTARLTGGSHD